MAIEIVRVSYQYLISLISAVVRVPILPTVILVSHLVNFR